MIPKKLAQLQYRVATDSAYDDMPLEDAFELGVKTVLESEELKDLIYYANLLMNSKSEEEDVIAIFKMRESLDNWNEFLKG